MFKKDDYIITLKVGKIGTSCGRDNYIFQQRVDHRNIHPYIDLQGNTDNGNDSLNFNKRESLIEWRYATPQEIEEYNRLKKPFDITTLPQEPQYEIY